MRYIFMFILLISLASAVTIQDLVLQPEGVNTKLIIKADAPFVANAFSLKDPPRLFVDCSGVSCPLIGKNIQ